MAAARPLRDVFADLVGEPNAVDDPAALLRDQGHPGLPDHLVAEAVVSYADTAPVEVAEHLAPYVTAHSVVGTAGDEPPADWPALLSTAPEVSGLDIDDLAPPQSADVDDLDIDIDPGLHLDFGTGSDQVPVLETETETEPEADEVDDLDDDFLDVADDGDITGWTVDDAEADDTEPDDEPDDQLLG
jgi:hypothetical protein